MNTLYSHPEKELKDHLFNVYQLGMNKFTDKNLNFNKMQEIKVLTEVVLISHDFGKATYFFQRKLKLSTAGKTETDEYKKLTKQGNNKSSHSLLSSVFTYYILDEILEDDLLSLIGLIVVYRHHSNLKDFKDMLQITDWEVLEKQFVTVDLEKLQKILNLIDLEVDITELKFEELKRELDSYRFRKKIRNLKKILDEEQNYLLLNLVYSILIFADKAEAIFYSKDMSYERLEKLVLDSKKINPNAVDEYKKIKGWNKANNKINKKRNEIYNEVVKKVNEIDLDKDRILSINVPTGTGKTLASLTAGLKLRQRLEQNHRLIYTLPFTSIIDQNYNVFENVFEKTNHTVDSSLMIKHHYLTPKSYIKESEYEDEEYDISKHLIESWNSEIIVTTFVQLLHSIFSNQNRNLLKFNNIANSIILLDEIQSIPHKYWELIKKMFREIAQLLDCYFIFITATMPLIYNESKGEIKELAESKKQYFDFFDRIKLDLSNFRSPKTVTEFKEFIEQELIKHKNDNVLIVLNTIKTSIEIYNYIQELIASGVTEGEPIYLSTNIIPKEREKRIANIGDDSQRQIVVSTQMIEAGVDIDLDRVYRDFAPLDSINQTCGRCNRNFDSNQGKVTLVKLVNEDHNDKTYASYIYSDILLNSTQKLLDQSSDLIAEKNFFKLNNNYFKQLNQVKSNDQSLQLLNKIQKLKYEKAFWQNENDTEEIFELIAQDFATVNLFIEIDEQAQEVWNKYEEINDIQVENMEDYSRRKEEFEKIKKEFLNYVITIPEYVAKEQLEETELENTFNYIDMWQCESVYDFETGFKRNNDEVNTFF